MKIAWMVPLGLALAVSPLAAEIAVPLTVSGQQATASVELPGGLQADLSIAFEGAVGLNAEALAVSASVLGPLDPVTSRLAALGDVGAPGAFPVVIRIEPSAASALSFEGVATISLHTHNLSLNPALPLSLFASSAGGPFRDITRSEGIGSYRAGGSTGGFSEFVLALDQRSITSVISGKFDAVSALLEAHAAAIAPATHTALLARLAEARRLYDTGAVVAAITEVGAFEADVRAAPGAAIPAVWRAHDSRPNVAGQLRSAALTLKFSLTRLSSSTLP